MLSIQRIHYSPSFSGPPHPERRTRYEGNLPLQRRPGTSIRLDSNNGDSLIIAVEAIQKPRPWETKRCARLRILLQRGDEPPKIVSRRAVREGQTITLPTSLIFLADNEERAAITFAPKPNSRYRFLVTAENAIPVLREELYREMRYCRSNDLPEGASQRKFAKWYEAPKE